MTDPFSFYVEDPAHGVDTVRHRVLVVQRPWVEQSSPELWVYLTETARLRLILTFVIDVAIIGYLFTGQSRRWLNQ